MHHKDTHVAASVHPYSRQRSSSVNKSKSGGFPSLTFSSLLQQPSPVPDYFKVQRSHSFGGRSATKRSDSTSRSQNRTTCGLNHIANHHRPKPIHPKTFHPLTHRYRTLSISPPSIGFVGKGRHSLHTKASKVNHMGRTQLRRKLSEVYVDRGRNKSIMTKKFIRNHP